MFLHYRINEHAMTLPVMAALCRLHDHHQRLHHPHAHLRLPAVSLYHLKNPPGDVLAVMSNRKFLETYKKDPPGEESTQKNPSEKRLMIAKDELHNADDCKDEYFFNPNESACSNLDGDVRRPDGGGGAPGQMEEEAAAAACSTLDGAGPPG